jgi:16S rRNA (uracil1498-N3)-methyltransferase
MNLFYAEPKDVNPPQIYLRGQEAKHAGKVMRFRTGDSIFITDGLGVIYHCKIAMINSESVAADIVTTEIEERKRPDISLLLGLIKKRDRLEFAIEKCVELGAARIILFKGDHSEKVKVRIDRAEAAAKSAMKQSLRFYLPEIVMEDNLRIALNKYSKGNIVIAADETKGGEEKLKTVDNSGAGYLLVIGPEGGFSKSERVALDDAGAITYSLGSKRLRTETAAIVITDRFSSR